MEPDYLDAHHNLAFAYDANQDGFNAILHLRIAKSFMEKRLHSTELINEVEKYLTELYAEYDYEPQDFENLSEKETSN